MSSAIRRLLLVFTTLKQITWSSNSNRAFFKSFCGAFCGSIPDAYYIDLIDSSKKEESLQKIKNAYEKISKDMDYVIIEGNPSIRKFIRVGLDDVSIAQALGINELIYVSTESSDRCIDNFFFTKNYFESRKVSILGILFNKIDYEYIARIKELTRDHINRYDIPVLGIIEKSLELFSPRVNEMKEQIGGSRQSTKEAADVCQWTL